MRTITTKHSLFAAVGFLIFIGGLAVPTSALGPVSCIRADLAETSCEITTVIPTGSPIRPDFRVFRGSQSTALGTLEDVRYSPPSPGINCNKHRDQVPALIEQRVRVVEQIPTRKERTV